MPSTRLRIEPDTDRVTPRAAARLVHLRYSDEFNAMRWSLEEAFDPATLAAIPMPDALRIPYLTTSQEKRLPDAERAAYVARKVERIAWMRTRWMRVPAWGGRKSPGGEYRYGAARCAQWHAGSLG